jgi:hypothetical protein
MNHLENSCTPQGHNAIYCRACMESHKHGRIKAWRMFVTLEDDPLKNFDCMVHAVCLHCDFEIFVPKQKPKSREDLSTEQLRQLIDRQMLAGIAQQPPVIVEYIRQQQEMQKISPWMFGPPSPIKP